MADTPNGLELRNLEVNYGAVRALKGVSLTVGKGQIVALLGANGAGKSTTLRAASGLVKPTSGSMFFFGTDITKFSAKEMVGLGLAHSPEGRRIFTGLTVEENLILGAAKRNDKREILADARKYMNMFPILEQRKRQLAGLLSGGEQQMLALARALMSRPSLLLLDEPSLGIAPLVAKSIFQTLSELRSQGVTILVVEQNVNLALSIADRAYVMRTGEVALEGSAKELQNNPRVVQAYLGTNEAADL